MGDKEAEMDVKELAGVLEGLWPLTKFLGKKTPKQFWELVFTLDEEYPFMWGMWPRMNSKVNEDLKTCVFFDGEKSLFIKISKHEVEAVLFDKMSNITKIITYREI